jgi:hypothetical protein
MPFPLALYQGTVSAVPERNAKIGGFGRWYPASGAKSPFDERASRGTAKAVP